MLWVFRFPFTMTPSWMFYCEFICKRKMNLAQKYVKLFTVRF